jgi:hypothetical protein
MTMLCSFSAQAQLSNSALSQGDWAEVSVPNEAIWRLSGSDLVTLGLPGTAWTSANIGVWGLPAGLLPEANAVSRSVDLISLPIWVDDGGDGSFDSGDHLYFYGQLPQITIYDTTKQDFVVQRHHYADAQTYFVTSTEGGRRVALTQLQPQSNDTINRHRYINRHEEDNVNLVGGGRQWFGEIFDFMLTRQIDLGLAALDANSMAKFTMRAVARSTTSSTDMTLETAMGQVGSINMQLVSASSHANYVDDARGDWTQAGNGVNAWGMVQVDFDRSNDPSATAWLDYLDVKADAPLDWAKYHAALRWLPVDDSVRVFRMKNASALALPKVWDVTDPAHVRERQGAVVGNDLLWNMSLDSARTVMVFTPYLAPTPTLGSIVANQDIRAWGQTDYVIVAPEHMLIEAERLAQFHRDRGLTVQAVDVQHVYNEFSGGVQDLTAIKDMMRMLWSNASSPSDKPEYLLLFGDCSYDMKGRLSPNQNQIPAFQSQASFSLYTSFVTDDYLGFMDDNEGLQLTRKTLDLCIGRMTVNTLSEAKSVVDKVIAYSDPSQSLGDWRKKVLFVSDDADAGWEPLLTTIPDRIAERLDTLYPFLDVEKIYSDSYVQQSSAGSQSYPGVRQDLLQNINDGNLVTTYVGHGGEVGWSSENILQLADVTAFSNGAKLPLFVTITCEFSRLDDPLRTSAGEELLMNPLGGAIALLSTTRVIYVDAGAMLSDSIFHTIFEKEDNNYRTFGQILRSAKNSTNRSDKLRFTLLGDPALRLNVPEHDIVIDSLNGLVLPAVSGLNDTLKALSQVRISGHIQEGLSGQVMSTFNGRLKLILFDKAQQRQTLRNDGQGPVINFNTWDNAAYRGDVDVVDGQFTATWFMPLDIALQVGKGRLSLYADNGLIDASGSDGRLLVGGINTSAPLDTSGPSIEVFIGNTGFIDGGVTGPDPLGLVRLSDPSGINVVGNGIGHDLMGALDGDWNQAFSMNSRFEADPNTYQSGQATWPFNDLLDGSHVFAVRAWDSYNNVSVAEVNFYVVSRDQLVLGGLRIYPNPGRGPFHLDLEHNASGDSLKVTCQILSASGAAVYESSWEGVPQASVLQPMVWDGRGGKGQMLPAGWYVVRMDVTRLSDGQKAAAADRLILLN